MSEDIPHLLGLEYVVEAYGCRPNALASLDTMRHIVETIVTDCRLRPIAPAAWHRFPGSGGITGLVMLAESHLACHTFPEFGSLTLNLFCCRPRPRWEFESRLSALLGAERVVVRELDRALASPTTALAGGRAADGPAADGPAA